MKTIILVLVLLVATPYFLKFANSYIRNRKIKKKELSEPEYEAIKEIVNAEETTFIISVKKIPKK